MNKLKGKVSTCRPQLHFSQAFVNLKLQPEAGEDMADRNLHLCSPFSFSLYMCTLYSSQVILSSKYCNSHSAGLVSSKKKKTVTTFILKSVFQPCFTRQSRTSLHLWRKEEFTGFLRHNCSLCFCNTMNRDTE